ncbi:hypothetical protein [Lujinxingia vulgaris]|uniref:hypothetical protein n=1 Tax=Lujinxingia vulgaris TaxID=2600176 RepID=UPI001E647319|nr:hypothetical protein [Lujinxingia vulgaris]
MPALVARPGVDGEVGGAGVFLRDAGEAFRVVVGRLYSGEYSEGRGARDQAAT